MFRCYSRWRYFAPSFCFHMLASIPSKNMVGREKQSGGRHIFDIFIGDFILYSVNPYSSDYSLAPIISWISFATPRVINAKTAVSYCFLLIGANHPTPTFFLFSLNFFWLNLSHLYFFANMTVADYLNSNMGYFSCRLPFFRSFPDDFC